MIVLLYITKLYKPPILVKVYHLFIQTFGYLISLMGFIFSWGFLLYMYVIDLLYYLPLLSGKTDINLLYLSLLFTKTNYSFLILNGSVIVIFTSCDCLSVLLSTLKLQFLSHEEGGWNRFTPLNAFILDWGEKRSASIASAVDGGTIDESRWCEVLVMAPSPDGR